MSKKARGRGRPRLTAAVVVILVAAAFAARFWTLRGEEPAASIREIQRVEGVPVEVVTAAAGEIEVWTTLAGTVEGIVHYPIVASNTIRVVDVLRREGDVVAAGDVVVRLETTAPTPMLHSLPRSQAVYEDALRDARRVRTLYEEGAVSRQQLDKAEMALEIAGSDLRNARGGIDLAAERAGVVTSVLVEKGEMAFSGSPVAWIARTDSVRIVFKAGSRQALVLRAGQRAVWFSSATAESGEGRIGRLDLSADPKTHLLAGEAVFPNPDGALLPGLLVSLRALTGRRSGVVTLPTGCLVRRDGEVFVFVVRDEDGRPTARLRPVATGLQSSDEIEISAGLQAGESVVVFGQTQIEEGTLVKIVAPGESEE